MKNNPMATYDMNNKPIVDVASTKSAFKQKDQNLMPMTKPMPEKSRYSEEVMPHNKVTGGSSAKLQKASRLPGRVDLADSNAPFTK